MKKALLIILTAILLISFSSCAKVDVDLRGQGNTYASFATFIGDQDSYEGKTVAFTAIHTAVYNFSENKIVRHSMSAWDAKGEKQALYEIRKSDGKYPVMGATATVIGTFRDGGYIEVDRFTDTKLEKRKFDVEATDMSAEELKEFIASYRKEYTNSEHFDDSIRIYGHCVSREGYIFLLGLDGEGKYIWEIELHDPTGKLSFPKAEGTTVNPVEIIGKLSTYVDRNVTYSCIEVESVAKVQSVFKTETEEKSE